jgi:hypothetical protein
MTSCSLVPIYRLFSARRYYIFQGRGISCQIKQLLAHTTVAEPFFPYIVYRCGSHSDSPTLKMNAGDPPETLLTSCKTYNTTSWMKVTSAMTSAVTSFRTSNFTTSFSIIWNVLNCPFFEQIFSDSDNTRDSTD